MRILFNSSIFPRQYNPNRGIYCFHICRAFEQLGHQVRAISPRSWLERAPRQPVKNMLPGLDQLKVEYPTYYYPPGVLRNAYASFLWASTRSALRRTMREFKPDFVLSYWAHPDGAVAVRAAHEFGVPGGFIVGGSDVLVLAKQGGARGRAIADAVRSADAVIGVSNQLRESVIHLGAAPDRAHVVYQGVNRELFMPGEQVEARRRIKMDFKGDVILFVGNLVPVKGLEVLLEACKQLRERGREFKLYLIGQGPLRQALEAKAEALELKEQVTFVGSVMQHELPDWYRSANVTVITSHSEGIPNVLRESMACQTPFVATRVGGINEVAAGTDNILVPPGDSGAFADAVIKSLDWQGPRTISQGDTGSWTQSAERLLAIIQHARAMSGGVASGATQLVGTG